MLIISYSYLKDDARLLKQINQFSKKYEISTIGFGPEPLANIRNHFDLDQITGLSGLAKYINKFLYTILFVLRVYSISRKLNEFNRKVRKVIKTEKWDIIFINNTDALSAAVDYKPTVGFFLDLHEYSPKQNEYSLWRHILFDNYHHWLCKRYLPKMHKITTVSQGLVEGFSQYGVELEVVTNASPYHPELSPNLSKEPLKLVHSGVYEPHRGIEILIDAVKNTRTDFTFDLFLMNLNTDSRLKLLERIGNNKKIKVHEGVPYEDLIPTLNNFDIGLFVLPPSQYSFTYALPNKLFDFIQARLGIIIGPSREMVQYVKRYRLGEVCKDYTVEALETVLNSLDISKVKRWKSNSHRFSKELSSETQVEIWDRLLDEMVTKSYSDAN